MSKKKVSVKVNPGQAVFVADAHVLEHIACLYEDMAMEQHNEQDKSSWLDVAISIREWAEKTYVPQEDYEDEEW